jgi:peptidoglycan/xylan/chitin deacetylase (PgdA/CDA1 family)
MDIAVTVDELIIWDGSPLPSGYTPTTITEGLTRALADHGISGVWGFPHTSPLDDEPRHREVLERWCAAGHHIGNHTHCHACLNWVSGAAYVEDIKRSEEVLGDLLDVAPERYFRYAMDMSGPSEVRRGAVEDHLRENGYTAAPITSWFGDFAWIVPYERALRLGDRGAAAMLRETYLQAALFNLEAHAAAARAMFGADLPYIWLIHGTSIAQDMLGEILAAFAARGARFISLPEAMHHPAHRALPPVSRHFRNHLQRYALATGTELAEPPPEFVAQVLGAAQAPDEPTAIEIYDDVLRRMNARVGGEFDWDWT